MAIHSNLISTEELQLLIGRSNVRIVDCRFDLSDPLAGRRAYRDQHIPGAVFADLDEDLSAPVAPDTGRHPLPDAEGFAETLGRLGIRNSTDVVVYDDGGGPLAARTWWLLRWLGHERVRLLDGGYQRWTVENRPLASGDEVVTVARFSPRPHPERILTTQELIGNFDSIEELNLIDARDAARFCGEVEPIDPVSGHIPGTSNLPYTVSLRDDGAWKSRAELESLWREVLGTDKQTAWAVMCGSGVTACHLAVSATQVGYREPRLYVGSWSEWIRDPARPIGLGEARRAYPKAADMA